jgi:hypothetical protein
MAPLHQVVVLQVGGAGPCGESGGKLRQLPDLFVERHFLQQRLDAGIQFSGCKLGIGHGPPLGRGWKPGNTGQQKQRKEAAE